MQTSAILSKHTAIIVPNELVSIITSIIDKFNENQVELNIRQPLPQPPPPPIVLPDLPPLPPPPPPIVFSDPPPAPTLVPSEKIIRDAISIVENKQNKIISVYYDSICKRGVHCYDEDCKLIHFPIHVCHHGDNCKMNYFNKCGFIHSQQKNVIQELGYGKFNLYEGWELLIWDWMKSAHSRAAHFKKEVIKSNTYLDTNVNVITKNPIKYDKIEDGEIKSIKSNHYVCIDWITKGCNDINCKNDHYLPSNYKMNTCENWTHNKCPYTGKYCKDIHGNDDLIVWYIKRNNRLFYVDGNAHKIKDGTRRSRSRSRDRDYYKHDKRYKH